MTYGQSFTPAVVPARSSRERGRAGRNSSRGVLLKIDGATVHGFGDIRRAVRLNPGVPITIVVRRGGEEKTLRVTPSCTKLTDRFGNHCEIGLLGIARPASVRTSADPR